LTSGLLQVDLRHIDLDRNGRAVLRDINWTVEPGQRWVVTGANGAGKTQLLKLVSGAVWPTPGKRGLRQYRWHGETYNTPIEVLDAFAYIGAERQDRYERYNWNFSARAIVGTGLYRTDIPLNKLTRDDRLRIDQLLAQVGIAALSKRRFLTLSYGERRLVLLARALAMRPSILLLDEAATGLDAAHHEQWRRWLESTADDNWTWILASHHAQDIPDCMTHELVLDQGRVVDSGRAAAVTVRRRLTAQATASDRNFNRHARRARRATIVRRAVSTEAIVSLQNASVYLDGHQALKDVSLAVNPGEFWIVTGANGSGKTTLLRTLYGDHGVAVGGSIVRLGIESGVPLEEFKRRVAYIAPHLQSDQPRSLPAIEVVASGRYASVGLNESATALDRREAVRALESFAVAHLQGYLLAELSYGQLRRVLFARAWVGRPQLALLDEPFAGLESGTRSDLLGRMERFVAEGGACILATHNRLEWPHRVTHRLELHGGRVRRYDVLS